MTIKDFFTPREGTGETAKHASFSVLENVIYFLFKSPYVLWMLSNEELKRIREKHELEIRDINSFWPFLIYLFRFVVYFLIHALIYLTVVLAPVGALVAGIAEESFEAALITFLGMYYAPIALRIFLEVLRVLWHFIKKYITYIWVELKPILITLWKLFWGMLRLVPNLCEQILGFVSNIFSLIFDIIRSFLNVFFRFFSYIANKCEFKAVKYEKRKDDLKK